jgi:uncharacterized membrane protein YjgN (DUF898 family)
MTFIDGTPVEPPRISWTPPPEGFLRLSLLNGLLRVLTLGVYHFWGKTEVRQRLWSAVRIDGEPLEYRGTGGELLRGFAIVFILAIVPLAIVALAPLLWSSSLTGRYLFQIVPIVIVIGLGGFGMFRARRYRLSRTRWRGIRGGLTGRTTPFAWTYFWTTLLIPVTLGWIVPWRAATLQRKLVNETQLGDQSFAFHGRSGPLYDRFWLAWVSAVALIVLALTSIGGIIVGQVARSRPLPGSPPQLTTAQIVAMIAIALAALLIFAMIRAWYSSRMLNYFASETSYQGRRFRLTTTVGGLVWLATTNYLMRMLSLGTLSPVAEARTMRYMVERLSLDGPIAWPDIGQNPLALMRGEGLAEAFDVDAF